ncbi:MAG: efflux RND transporter periplasmic adaptor subunit [Candidatus Obscuribacterales bacterium]|nr:efflux RND transporter periplasmic adaptor subunit [Candidatus Obscuribacterales bacterium]
MKAIIMKKPVVLSLTLFTFSCVALTSCSRQEAHEDVSAPAGPVDRITLSPKAIEHFGLTVVTVVQRSDIQTLSTTGEIKADENRVFHINSLSNGRVVTDNVMLGDIIHPGQTLAVVQNLDVAKVYGDYIHQAHQNKMDINLSETRLALATKNYNRIKALYQEKIAAEKDFLKAEADKELEQETLRGLKEHATHIKEEARAMLAAYGVKLGDGHSDHIESNSPITTPRGGVIIKKTVTVGDVVSNSEPLYVVGDLSHVWLDIAVYDKQLQSIKEGDEISFTSDSLPGRILKSHISYIKPSTEDGSGTFVARAVLDNPHLDLKPGMLGQVKIHQRHAEQLAFIPGDALQKYGKEQFVFLAEPGGSYKKQPVELAKKVEGGYLITHGLTPGQRIVSKGSFTLKAEMLKGTMAGED